MNAENARAQSFKPLSNKAANQESFNRRITHSTNQPIKFGIGKTTREISRRFFRVSPLPGEWWSNAKTQTKSGGGVTASASGIQVSGRPLASEPGRLSQLMESWAAGEFSAEVRHERES